MKTGIKRLIVTALALCLCIESEGALAIGNSTTAATSRASNKFEAGTTNSAKTDTKQNIQTISSESDGSELADMIQSHWDDSYFEHVVIDPEQKTVSKDGEKTTVQDALDLNKKDAATVMKSTDSAEKYFSDSVYKSDVKKDGDVVVTAPFQTMRIVVSTNSLADTYGAAEALHYPEYNKYILQYDTQEATQEAYTKLIAKYGSDCCGLDKVLIQDELFRDTSTTSTTSASSCYSWGATLMGMDHLKAEEKAESDGETATVAVIDSGIDTQNKLFDGRTILSTSLNFVEDDSDVHDDCGHGTHVAGTIADCTPDNINFLILRALDNNGYGTALTFFLALEYAVEEKADVINMSFGCSTSSISQPIKDLLDLEVNSAYQEGIPIFAAAGNDSQDVSTTYPACNSQTIAVSALNSDETFASVFSNYGSGIDFAAPGVDIISAWTDGYFAQASGTSMAAPHMAAAAAYIKLHNPNITVSGLYQVLKRYAVDAGTSGKDDLYGWGYVNLYSYYNELGKATVSTLINIKNGISVNWKKVAGASGYYVYRKTGSSSSWKKVKTISSGSTVSWTDTKASNGTNYSYMVRAYGNGSVGLHQSTKTACRLSNVNTSTLKNSSGRKLTLTWNKNSKATGYQIQYATSSKFSGAKTITIKSYKTTSSTISKLTKNKKYYVHIRAYKAVSKVNYYSTWSNTKSVTIRK